MTKVFIQGMRRSATTFLYDVLCADGRFDAYYEPLAKAKRAAVGGGSRVREEDFFEKIRQCRSAYATASGLGDSTLLNWGAPRDASAEVEGSMDERVVGYLRFLLEQSENTLLKFVRAYNKVEILRELEPQGVLLHIVRDPRAVASSFLLGKGQVHRSHYVNADVFFDYSGDASFGPMNLQALKVFDELRRRELIFCEADAPYFERLLALWGYHFRQTDRAGREEFGDRYCVLRYEELIQKPKETLARVYATLGEPCQDTALAWLEANVADRPQIFAEGDERWSQSLERLKLADDLTHAGYRDALPTVAVQ